MSGKAISPSLSCRDVRMTPGRRSWSSHKYQKQWRDLVCWSASPGFCPRFHPDEMARKLDSCHRHCILKKPVCDRPSQSAMLHYSLANELSRTFSLCMCACMCVCAAGNRWIIHTFKHLHTNSGVVLDSGCSNFSRSLLCKERSLDILRYFVISISYQSQRHVLF